VADKSGANLVLMLATSVLSVVLFWISPECGRVSRGGSCRTERKEKQLAVESSARRELVANKGLYRVAPSKDFRPRETRELERSLHCLQEMLPPLSTPLTAIVGSNARLGGRGDSDAAATAMNQKSGIVAITLRVMKSSRRGELLFIAELKKSVSMATLKCRELRTSGLVHQATSAFSTRA